MSMAVNTQKLTSAVFEYETQYCSYGSSHERSYIWNDVEYAGHEGNSDGRIHSQSGYQPKPEEVDECDSSNFYKHSYEIS